MNPFIPNHDLSTMIRHFTTHTNRSFDHTESLYDPMQSHDCIESLVSNHATSAPCMILARLYMTGWVPATIKIGFDCDRSFPSHIESALRLHTSRANAIALKDLYTTFGRPIHTPLGACISLGSTVTHPHI